MTERVEFETYLEPDGYAVRNLCQEEPSCFNGTVRARRYRVVIEEIEEPVGVIAARLRKMYEESDNSHHMRPLMEVAEQFNIDTDSWEWAKHRKRG